ncbi:MAG TPA: RDD family protein [Sphingomonadaceae bacterium]|nr:RDD family protein [Sphingomonadaceae bacterium]
MTAVALRRRDANRIRSLVTPEGLSLPVTVASKGARAGALVLDLIIMLVAFVVVSIAAASVATQIYDFDQVEGPEPVLELVMVLWIIAIFVFRYGYFLFFELGPRGATPGKRMVGIRIAARDGGRLKVEAVIARNLLRDIEIFLPIEFMLRAGFEGGLADWAALAWLLLFLFFPFFNKDRLRAGDLIAGTWVLEAPRRKLEQAMSVGEAARGVSATTGAQYQFGDEELSVYGEYELQALEQVLRQNNPKALKSVADTICGKIGWHAGSGDERAFLEAFYAQLRARLEGDMRFGKRKADKYS